MAAVIRCRSCQAPMVMVLTERRRNMPLDAERDGDGMWVPKLADSDVANIVPTGRTAFGKMGAQTPVVRVVGKGAGRWVSHFATCPNGGQHRRRR